MFTVVGDDEALRQALVAELSERGQRIEPLELEGAGRAVVVVAERRAAEEDLDEARRAVTLRGGEIVFVTPRADADIGLRALRRWGLPYSVVRTGPYVEDEAPRFAVLPPTLTHPVRSRALLGRELAAEIAADRTGTGAVLELGRTTSGSEVAGAVRAASGTAWVLPRWLFSLCALLGGPAYDGDASGRLVRAQRVAARLGPGTARAPRPRALGRAGAIVALLCAAVATRTIAQDAPDACRGAEPLSARKMRLSALIAALHVPGRSDGSRSPSSIALAANHRASAYRPELSEAFEMLRAAALAMAGDASASARVRSVRFALADEPGLPTEAVTAGCGEHRLTDDAWVSRAFDTIVLCPGFVLLEADAAERRGESSVGVAVAEASTFLLAHELGHVLVGAVSSPATERAADALAAEILRRTPYATSPRALASFCALPADPVHDAGPARVERVLRALHSGRARS